MQRAPKYLKSCPFCGADSATVDEPEQADAIRWTCSVTCKNCESVFTTNQCYEDAIEAAEENEEAWNRRNISPISVEQVLGAYQFATFSRKDLLRGTSNWCAEVARELNFRLSIDTSEVDSLKLRLDQAQDELLMLSRQIEQFQDGSHGIKNLSAIEGLRRSLGIMTRFRDEFEANAERLASENDELKAQLRLIKNENA